MDFHNEKTHEEIISNAKMRINELIDTFFMIKECKLNNPRKLISFQVELAKYLYELAEYHRKLCLRKRDDDYKIEKMEVVSLIKQGKAVGDGYAWVFYHNNIEALREHLHHSDNGLFPARNGGLGEIEFIKSNVTYKGYLVVYHSITNMLRIGDFSLVDKNGKLVALGEIKTKQCGNELEITAYISSKVDINEDIEKDIDTNEMWASLIKQIECQDNLLANPILIDIISGFDMKYNFDMISKSFLCDEVVTSLDKSMAVYVIDTEREDAEKFYSADYVADKVIKKMECLCDKRFICNNIEQVTIVNTMRIWEKPIIWWECSSDILKKIILGKWVIITFFNKGSFYTALQDKGYTVEIYKKRTDIYKIIDNNKVAINNVSMFENMISQGFVDMASVVEIIDDVINKTIHK